MRFVGGPGIHDFDGAGIVEVHRGNRRLEGLLVGCDELGSDGGSDPVPNGVGDGEHDVGTDGTEGPGNSGVGLVEVVGLEAGDAEDLLDFGFGFSAGTVRGHLQGGGCAVG